MAHTFGKRRRWRSTPSAPAPESGTANPKLFYVGLIVFLVFGILTLQLTRLQLIDGSQYRQRAEENRLRQVAVLPSRGLIYDRHGIPLVENKASYSAAVVPADLPKARETAILIELQELVGVPAGEMAEKIDDRRLSNDPFSPLVLKEDISGEKAFLIRERLAFLPGVRVLVESRRDYVEGPLLSHVMGYTGRIAITSDRKLR